MNLNFGCVSMKTYKFYTRLIILITFSFQAFALDCNKESAFSIPNDHWLRQESHELQFYVVRYLYSKTLHECINEKLPEERLVIRNGLLKTIGKEKLRTLETEYDYFFDTKSAFDKLGIDIYSDSFLENLRAFSFDNIDSQ